MKEVTYCDLSRIYSQLVYNNTMNLTDQNKYCLNAIISWQDSLWADPLPNWVGTDSSPCGWMGVTCNSNNEELVLGSNSLSGLIPPQIGTLSSLQYLDLSSNTFSGTVPLQLGNLVNLQHLDLSSNALSGSIPEEISLLRSLRKLDLGGNSFVGSIPDSIGNLRNLQTLNLPSNQLTGPIPPELAQLTNLTTLDLSCNMLNGSIPAEIGEVGKLQGLNLAYNSLTGQIPPQLGDIASLTKLNLSGNMLSGSIPNTLGNLTGLSYLDLGGNQFSGSVPNELSNLVQLIYLDLSNNHLSGMFPPELCELRYLTFLNMSYNDLEGQIPSTGMCAKLGASSFIADPGLCGGILGTECTSNYMTMTPTNLLSTGAILGITIGCTIAFLSLLFVVLSSTCLTMAKSKEPLSINVAMFEQPLLRLTLADILLATNNFCKTNIIGDGGFGTVYKAILPDGKTVAIKKLGAARTQGNREFLAEMETLGKVKHRNLVPLLGYCSFGEEKLLVYEYMVNGSLDLWLRNRADAVEVLDWNKRFKIAMGSARGLNFLHHGFIPHIIHRDVKTSNILLDADFEPRVADFGLARLISAYETHVSTDIAGTFGYIPPEYGQSWRSTTRGDVYSYGVILLELLTGKEPTGVEFKEMEGGNLVGWVRQMIKQGAAQDVLDPTVSNGSCKMSMLKVLHIANLCTAEDPLMRPTMLQVNAEFHHMTKHIDVL
ncbi:unnamed protein product [Sphagnum jensenii]|uniref:Protein kinase domain-containing protein n=1 Tax=Sphagnum jensenii TaxID=128206 RepID=A0ABP1BEB6_9BRYO